MLAVPDLLLKPSAPFGPPVGARLDWDRVDADLRRVFREHSDRFSSMIDPQLARASSYGSELAAVKRFGERWVADRSFRAALPLDPTTVAKRYGLEADAEELRCLWDAQYRSVQSAHWQPPLSVQRYRVFLHERLLLRERMRKVDCVPSDPRHRVWRARQINRSLGHLGSHLYESIIHAPFAIEVSLGCSAGCWFCGVSAERKKADFLYTPDNARLWRRVLEALQRRLGTAASTGFLYWATDPLDNPDYEQLCADMADVCGRFPSVTTVQPQKYIERTRSLLRVSEDRGCFINRFSILTLKQFDQVMDAFSAEELLHCEIVAQNPESSHIPGSAGRARGAVLLKRRAESHGLNDADGWQSMPGTIACVSGWLINMVEQRIRLVTPCPASDRWPDGYWVLDDRRFRDGEEFEALLEDMMAVHMSTALAASRPVRVRPDLSIASDAKSIQITAGGTTTTVAGTSFLPELASALASGQHTAGEIALAREDLYGFPAANTMLTLNQLFDAGLLDEEPHD